MIICKHTSDSQHGAFQCQEDVNELSKFIRNACIKKEDFQKVFVWSGFGGQISAKLFQESNWQQSFVGLFGNQRMWPWKYKFSKTDKDQIGNQDLMEALKNPSKSFIASLRIRQFESDDLFQGSPEWFEEIAPYLNADYYQCKVLIDHIIQSILIAKKLGIKLYLEKISLMASFDTNDSITLTPHLHRDGAYGHLESAIVSFYSESITPNSSTLFFPDFNFEAASHLKPITAEKLKEQFDKATGYSLASGSLAIFSGKRAKDGAKSDTRGALHMSPEGFFPTRRLALLFRSNISC